MNATNPKNYIGRFAPSPSGTLHFGSLITALGSYLDARSHNGRWLLRMEDHDPPREMPGAADDILRTLEAYGFVWDGPVEYQSRRAEHYLAALNTLAQAGLSYYCSCTRSQLSEWAVHGPLGLIYPGNCRERRLPAQGCAFRLRVADRDIRFSDRIQGSLRQNLARELGDFVLKRRDGLFAYQLVVVVDDALQGVSDIVRGADLFDNTPRQIYLQQLLGLPTPRYAHLPIATNANGEKLSKQTFASPIDPTDPLPTLLAAWQFLRQPTPPDELTSIAEFWSFALTNWSLAAVPKQHAIAAHGA